MHINPKINFFNNLQFPGLRIYRAHEPSKSLQSIKREFAPTEECRQKISKAWLHLVEDDIFCVGDKNSSKLAKFA